MAVAKVLAEEQREATRLDEERVQVGLFISLVALDNNWRANRSPGLCI